MTPHTALVVVEHFLVIHLLDHQFFETSHWPRNCIRIEVVLPPTYTPKNTLGVHRDLFLKGDFKRNAHILVDKAAN